MLLLDLFGLLFVSSLVNNGDNDTRGQQDFKYYSNRKGSRVVEVSRQGDGGCHVFEGRDAAWFLQTRRGGIMKTLNYIQFEILLQTCHPDMQNSFSGRRRNNEGFKDESELNRDILMEKWNKTKPSNFLPDMMDINTHLFNDGDVSLFMDELNKNGTSEEEGGTPLIYPGTRWCGRGDIARSSDDLGVYTETDKCCREHDHCPDNIPARRTKHNLTNEGDYTRSHCECDQKFLTCLERDASLSALTSFKIANLYFNILKPECFDRRHAPLSCQKKRLTGECISYLYNFQTPASYQFFSAQPYIVRPARKLYDNIFYGNVDLTRPHPTSIPLPDLPIIPNLSPIRDNLVG